jgi:hypothetical protein
VIRTVLELRGGDHAEGLTMQQHRMSAILCGAFTLALLTAAPFATGLAYAQSADEQSRAARIHDAAEDLTKQVAQTNKSITEIRVVAALEVVNLAGSLAQPGVEIAEGKLPSPQTAAETITDINETYQNLTADFETLNSLQQSKQLAQAVLDQTVSSYSQPSFVGAQIASAAIEPTTVQSAQLIISKYKSVPGGIVFEGSGGGLPQIRSIVYLKRLSCFIINGRDVYASPVTFDELTDIFHAEAQHDEIGVSLGRTEAVIYGPLNQNGPVATRLFLSDEFLGQLAFGSQAWVDYYRFPNGFEFRAPKGDEGLFVVMFSFTNDGFTLQDNVLKSRGVNLVIRYIPLVYQDGSKALSLDLGRISAGVPQEFRDNANELAQHFDYYRRERLVRSLLAYAEIVDFARLLRRSGVDLNQVLASAS